MNKWFVFIYGEIFEVKIVDFEFCIFGVVVEECMMNWF